ATSLDTAHRENVPGLQYCHGPSPRRKLLVPHDKMFEQLAGNDEVKARLRRLLATGRAPNALLFAGPEGIGKQALAFELARAFVCTAPVDHEGCGDCSACRRVGTFAIPEPTEKNKDDFKRVFFGEHADV